MPPLEVSPVLSSNEKRRLESEKRAAWRKDRFKSLEDVSYCLRIRCLVVGTAELLVTHITS